MAVSESLAALVPTDDLYPQQWHLNPASAWNLNVQTVWDAYTGAGIPVAVFDQGIDALHVDLDANIDQARGFSTFGGGDGAPRRVSDNHGTAVAGIIGAELRGGDVVGVAFDAKLIPIYTPLVTTGFANQVAAAFAHARTTADVINNSWGYGNLFQSNAGSAFVDDFDDPTFARAADALRAMSETGRGGLGTVVLQAAGNAKEYGDNTNLHSFQNSIYSISVAAMSKNGDAARYSTPGASVHVAAPGEAITTTDRTGGAGYAPGDYATSFTGTSAAAPMVSGVVALMLDANPSLGARDVHQILAYSAVNSDPDQSSTTWQINGAKDWNGGGLHFSHDLGFGLVDAHAAVQLAKSWAALGIQHTYTNALANGPAPRMPLAAIPDDDPTGVIDSLFWGFDRVIDRVEIDIGIVHTYIGDLVVELTSPSGTTATLLNRPGVGLLTDFGSAQQNIDFTFTANAFLGESAAGEWTLSVKDRAAADQGTLTFWRMHFIYDDAADGNSVYTDEFSDYATPARRMLDDTDGGIDTINTAAVTSGVTIDLTPGQAGSRIDGETLILGAEGLIENAHGGVGDDILTGNAAANRLWGDDGGDVLKGGDGNDRLFGGLGNDRLFGGLGIDSVKGDSGNDRLSGDGGDDRLRGGIGDDQIYGRDGEDILRGGGGGDTLAGGRDDDNIKGQAGDDLLLGDTGDDRLVGGAGADAFMFAADFGRDIIADFDPDEGDAIWLDRAGLGVSSLADLVISTIAGGDGVVALGEDGIIVVKGFSIFSGEDFVFV